jgi:hypothetical protein
MDRESVKRQAETFKHVHAEKECKLSEQIRSNLQAIKRIIDEIMNSVDQISSNVDTAGKKL